ncbi:hypothetical protein Arnit_2045 [Arcobacter nitrofigilis DSM 7299]|uniref:Uncharacterized protein n=1 Tax=Arcobacter nitrofigilis (strain ATCC 33309 / DSM 7299 / CCUG 15893 / LMG 7604 / NCTC 12251 / CI) TaxID=572480 RepID=D5V087_ARCNC|nr:hypothetical protein [Arcobacter nitrofigilis]ADG93699.1 hypothetical protein Arnit_2045 [Arcobacter nitrofigilis DSM 7299]
MTSKEITNHLNKRGYILESDCIKILTLPSTAIEKYDGKNSKIIVDKESWNCALYNPKKFDEEQVLKRLKYKRTIANYLCKAAKQKLTKHYQEFNSFLNTFGLDYFSDNDTRYLVEEISSDFRPITNAVITAILVTNKGIPSDGFWTLADIQNRCNGLDQNDFHKNELEKLSSSLKDYDCCD